MEVITSPVSILFLLIGVVFHEYAHALIAYWFGDMTAKLQGRLTLNPLKHLDVLGTIAFFLFKIGWAKPVPVDFLFLLRKGVLHVVGVLLAGPGANLLLGLIGVIGSKVFPLFLPWWLGFSYINIALAVFNLLPFPPLDGGRVFLLLLKGKKEIDWSTYEFYGILALVLFLLLGGDRMVFEMVTRIWLFMVAMV